MEELKSIIAENIIKLRTYYQMTQIELAEKLNYSDKTISKWERGESTPDIAVLVAMAELFCVSLDDLTKAGNVEDKIKKDEKQKPRYSRRAITHLAEGTVIFLAMLSFIITSLIMPEAVFRWLYFIYAVPVMFIVRLVLNSIWFNRRHNYLIISGLMWTTLATIHITFLFFNINVSLIYLLGVVGQAMIIIWSFIRRPKQ